MVVFVLRPSLQWGHNFIVAEMMACANPPGTQTTRFNGAATSSLRKFGSSQYPYRYPFGLQWGRNFIVAEIESGTASNSLPTWLQWSRNFIVAEMQKEHQRTGSQICASMGPQLYRCGNGQTAGRPHSDIHASMGPQLYRCGNFVHGLGYDAGYGASMGPQLYRCGNLSGNATTGWQGTWLQWGRNFIVAETPLPT